MRLAAIDRVVLTVALAAILSSVVLGQFAAHGNDLLPRQSLCWSVRFFHRECPGCGLTRSFVALGRGDVAAANDLNPLGPILFVYALALIAIRIGKAAAPRFRWWAELDLALGATVVLCFAIRALSFYRG